MKVLAVASELHPLVKTGGLADVVGALPGALGALGVEVRTLLPGYPAVMVKLTGAEPVLELADLFGGPARVLMAKAAALDLLVLDAPHLYNRPGNPYLSPDGTDWTDNALRYAALAAVAAQIGRSAIPGFVPDLVHCHDWQAGLVPALLRFGGGPKSVFTVHNLAFQGHFPVGVFASLGLPAHAFGIDGVEYFGGVGYLKAGLRCADALTTVSPSYAREICTEEDGMGLGGLLATRRADLHGIVNGIDTAAWNPAKDPVITQSYTVKTLERRAANRRALEQRFDLAPSDGLLYIVVSRLTLQKGMDLVAAAADTIVTSGARLAVLGAGDAVLERALSAAAAAYPGRIGVITGYDEQLSHQMQAGADAILIPSRFEPCGLTQLYGLRYGCVPVVARVGGLADTVIDANDAAVSARVATGVQFAPVTQDGLEAALERTSALFANRPLWRALQVAGMAADLSWTRSAERYVALYRSLL